MSHMLNIRWRHRWRDITPGWGGSFFLGEGQSRMYPNMCAKFGCGPTVVSKKRGYRQTDALILYGNLANIQHITQVTCWSLPDYQQYNVVTQSIHADNILSDPAVVVVMIMIDLTVSVTAKLGMSERWCRIIGKCRVELSTTFPFDARASCNCLRWLPFLQPSTPFLFLFVIMQFSSRALSNRSVANVSNKVIFVLQFAWSILALSLAR